MRDGSELTVSAVLARPALHALAVPLGVAGPVAQGEVPGLTVGGAGLAVVVLLAHHVVGEAQLALAVEVDVLRPVLAHRQRAARRQPADQVVLVLVPWTETQQNVSGAAGRTGRQVCCASAGSGLRDENLVETAFTTSRHIPSKVSSVKWKDFLFENKKKSFM